MIYLLRHGEIEDSDSRRYIGQTDCALNIRGRAQAEFWKKWLEKERVDSIFCSDLIRSSVTAEIISQGRQVALQVNPDLREINLGEWDGRSMQEIRDEFPAEWEARGAHIDTFRPPGGESFADLYQRVIPVVEHIAETVSGPALIVGHAGVNRVILCHVLGMPIRRLFSIRQDFAALNLLDNSKIKLQVAAVNLRPENVN